MEEDEDIVESIMLEDGQPLIIDDDDASLDIIELSRLDIDEQSIEDDIIELSMALDELWASVGAAAAARAPATSKAATTANSFFISCLC